MMNSEVMSTNPCKCPCLVPSGRSTLHGGLCPWRTQCFPALYHTLCTANTTHRTPPMVPSISQQHSPQGPSLGSAVNATSPETAASTECCGLYQGTPSLRSINYGSLHFLSEHCSGQCQPRILPKNEGSLTPHSCLCGSQRGTERHMGTGGGARNCPSFTWLELCFLLQTMPQ